MEFIYKARSTEGKIVKGVVKAFSKRKALDVLEKYGFYVTFLKKQEKKNIFQKEISSLGKIPLRDLAAFTRQLAVMLKSGIAIDEALRIRVSQAGTSRLRDKIIEISEEIENGSSLSQSFSLYPKVFNPFYISCIKSGEASGKLAESLDYLADHLEEEYKLKSKIKGAMIYPIFVICVFIAIFFVLTIFVAPKLIDVLQSFGQEMPLQTRIIINLSKFTIQGGWAVILIFFGVLFMAFEVMKKSKKGIHFWDSFSLRMPIIGDFYKKIYLIQFCENISVLIAAGVPITRALDITRDVIKNVRYKEVIGEIKKRVLQGESISTVLRDYPKLMPAFLTQMVFTGEKTGRLGKILTNIVNFYRAEVDRKIEGFLKLLEPVLILVLGGAVGILAMGILLPIFQAGLGGTGI